MKLQTTLRKSGAVALLLILSFCINSCKKEDKARFREGPATVKIKLLGAESNVEPLKMGKGVKPDKFASADKVGQAIPAEDVQTMIVPFSDNLSIVATLTREDIPATNRVTNSRNLMAVGAPIAAVVQQALASAIKYKVVVYNSTGDSIASNTYSYGTEASEPAFELNAGESYTFVAYSINSTTTVPVLTNGELLSTASIDNVSGEYLMYFKKVLTPSFGENFLNVILKHQFSQITTTIELDATATGNIEAIDAVVIRPTSTSATIKLNDTISYSEETMDTPVIFNGIGTRTVISDPTFIIAPDTLRGRLNIGSITIGGETKENIEFHNLNIASGHRYSFKLKFQRPCVSEVGLVTIDRTIPSLPDGATPPTPTAADTLTFKISGANNGFIMDLTKLRISFSMEVNGMPLISHGTLKDSHEIQFGRLEEEYSGEHYQGKYPFNVLFADGTYWDNPDAWPAPDEGDPDLPNEDYIFPIYSPTGDLNNPVFRLVISPTGDVFMYAIKEHYIAGAFTTDWFLHPIVLTKGFYFNKIDWDPVGENTITLSQIYFKERIMKGTVKGLRICD